MLPASALVQDIRCIINNSRARVVQAVNNSMVQAYWEIGRRIFEEEQKGQKRAEYGKGLIASLSVALTEEFGKGFSTSNLANMRAFYSMFPNFQTLSGKLSWSHYLLLLKVEDERARAFYLSETAAAQWSVRQPERQLPTLCQQIQTLPAE